MLRAKPRAVPDSSQQNLAAPRENRLKLPKDTAALYVPNAYRTANAYRQTVNDAALAFLVLSPLPVPQLQQKSAEKSENTTHAPNPRMISVIFSPVKGKDLAHNVSCIHRRRNKHPLAEEEYFVPMQ